MVVSYIRSLQSYQPGYPLEIMSYSTQALVYNLVVNSMHSIAQPPIACGGSDCGSYLLTGGLLLTTPWPSIGYSSSPVIKINNVIGRQIEFKRNPGGVEDLQYQDCTAYGDNGTSIIAIKFCIAQNRPSDGASVAGKSATQVAFEDNGLRNIHEKAFLFAQMGFRMVNASQTVLYQILLQHSLFTAGRRQ
jgi:hypothetical protein